jgi:hypothetical protein
MTSGAYHDAMIMGRRVPVGMIFVPSAGGVSHHPDEYTAPDDLERACSAGGTRRGWRPNSITEGEASGGRCPGASRGGARRESLRTRGVRNLRGARVNVGFPCRG